MVSQIDSSPKVSIVMPAHDASFYISEAIDSVLQQTYANWELLIVDDGLVDAARTIVEDRQALDARIRVLRNKCSKGPAGARNTGIQASRGRYIAFLDSDDEWYPIKLACQVPFMLAERVVFSFSSYCRMSQEGRPIGKTIKAPLRLTYKQLLHFNPVGCLTAIYDTSALGKVFMPEAGAGGDARLGAEQVRRLGHEDYAMWLSILKRVEEKNSSLMRVAGLIDTLACYRVHSHGISSNKLRAGLFAWDVYRRHQRFGLVRSVVYTIRYGLYGVLRKIINW